MRNRTHLHYGSLVSLKIFQQENSYLSADGFIQKCVVAQDYRFNSDGLRNVDFLDSVFQVLPLYQYEKQQEIQKQLDQFYRDETQKFEQDINSVEDDKYDYRLQLEKKLKDKQKFEENIGKQEKYLQNLSHELNKELAQNDLKFNKNKNLNIAYGEKFQLQHYRSKKYLCLSNLSFDDNYQNSFSLQLENNPSEMTFFKFVSAYKHQLDLSKDVQFDDHVYLAIDIEKEGYIYFLNQENQKMDNQEMQKIYQDSSHNDFDKSKDNQKSLEIFLKEKKSDFFFKFMKQTIFELKLYCECIEDDKRTVTQEDISTLIYGDIVWITENQSESYLECVDNVEDETMKGTQVSQRYQSLSQYQVASNKDEYEIKQKQLNKIQQRTTIQLSLLFKKMQSSQMKNTRGLWKIEAPQMESGGPISTKSKIRLKNIRNGMYLAIVQENANEEEQNRNYLYERSYMPYYDNNKQKKQRVGIVEMHQNDIKDQSATLFSLIRKDDNNVVTANNEYLYEFLYDIQHEQTKQFLGQMYVKDFSNQKDRFFLNDIKPNLQSSNVLHPNNSLQNISKNDSNFMSTSVLEDNAVKINSDDETDNVDEYQKRLAAVITTVESNSKEFIKLYKAPHEDVWEILFLLSCIPQLQKGINLLKYVQENIVYRIESMDNLIEDFDINSPLCKKIKIQGDSLEKQFLQFNKLIQSIIQFCYERSSLQTNQAKEGKFRCNIKRQRLLREQGVLRYVTLVVKYLFQENKTFKWALLNQKQYLMFEKTRDNKDQISYNINDDQNTKIEKQEIQTKIVKIFKGLQKITRACYHLIYQICLQNFDNQVQAFKYIKIYKNHIGFNLGAENCIIAIFQDNEDLLLAQNFADILKMPDDLEVEQNIIQKNEMLLKYSLDEGIMFGKKQVGKQKEVQVPNENKLINIILQQYKLVCEKEKNQKGQQFQILDLLICLCKNGQESLTINQSSICDLIFTRNKYNKHLYDSQFMKIMPLDKKIEIENLIILTDTDRKTLELLEFYKKSNDNIIINKKKFVQKLFLLYASLCSGRNYNCIEKVKAILPFMSIQSYLWSADDSEILSSIISILDCVYIDRKPQYHQCIPDLVHSVQLVPSNQQKQKVIYGIQEDDDIIERNEKMGYSQQNIEMEQFENYYEYNQQANESREDEEIKKYLRMKVFNTIIQYLEKCKASSEIRNKSLTLNTIELIRKFIVFDLFSITEKRQQQQIYQELLTNLRLGPDEKTKIKDVHKQEFQETSAVSKFKQFLTGKPKDIEKTQANKKVHFGTDIKEKSTFKNRFSKQRIPRKSVKDTLQREAFSNLYRKQIQSPNEDPGQTQINEKSSRQTNIDIKKKIAEIFLIYIDLKINNQIDKIIQHIRNCIYKQKLQSEDVIYQHMQKPETIQDIFPKIELPLATLLKNYNQDSNDPFKDYEKKKKREEDEEFPALNFYLKDQTSLNEVYDSKITEKSEQLLISLLDIFLLNSDYQLNCLILNIIFKNFSLGKHTIKVSKNLIIISDEEEVKIDSTIETTIKEFSFMCETSETWFVHASRLKLLDDPEWVSKHQDEHKILLKQKEEVCKCIEQIKDLNKLMYVQSVQEKKIFDVGKNASQIKMIRQFMMKNANSQKLIMDMLKDNIHILEEINKYDSSCQITQVFTGCFTFLKNFCLKDNKINKKELYKDVKFFIRFMKYVDVGQTDLINEIYQDNYKASTEVDDDIIRLYLEKICHPNSQNGYGGRHIRYIQFIQNIMFFKKLKMPITNNIWKVIQNIQITMSTEKMLVFLYMKRNDFYDKNKSYCDCDKKYYGQYIFDLEMPQNVVQQVQKPCYSYIFEEEFQFNQPFLYHQKLLNSILDIIRETEGKSSFFKNILLKYLPCDYLLFFLQKEDYFIQDCNKNRLVLLLKKPLCQIFLILYADQQNLQNYQKQILESSHTQRFLDNEIKKMSMQLQKLSDQMINTNKSVLNYQFNQYQNYQHEIPLSNQINSSDKNSYKARNEGLEEIKKDQSYYEEFVYENRLYQTLCSKIEKSELDYIQWLTEYSLPMINFIFKISSKFEKKRVILEDLLKKYKIEDQINKNQMFQSSNIIQKTLLETKKYIFQQDQGISVRTQSSRFNQKNSQLYYQISNNQFDGDLEQYVSLPLQNILSSKGSSLVQDKYTKIFLLNMLIMDEMKQIINLEKRSFIQAIQKIDKVLNDEKSQKISTIFPRFTSFLRISFNQYSISKGWNEYRVIVDIMRTMILLLDNPLDRDEIKKANEAKQVGSKSERQAILENMIQKKRESYQDLFANYNLPKYLLEMLCNKDIDYKLHHQSIKLRRTIFSLLNALLQGGNLKIQNQIYQFFVQNANSQLFFDMVSDMIDEEIKKTLNVSIYDEIEQDLETIEFVYRSKDKFLGISEVLKTIQLLCLGQFKKNQNYIRQQTNSRNSINLIEKISDLFDIVIRNHNIPDQLKIDLSSLQKANQILDTLIESIQGPVYENQLELIQSKILKSICDILTQEENIEYIKFKNKQNPKGKSKLSSEQQKKNNKLNGSKQEIQVRLIDNLKNLSKKFSEKVANKFFKTNENWMVSKLKNKCIQFLESLLEGNQDSFILNKIMNDIPQQTLSENLGIVFGKLKQYKQQSDIKLSEKLFRLSFVKIEEILQIPSEQREKYGIIVDTGFRVYHLLVLYYQENKNNNLKSLNFNQDIDNQEEFQYQNYILEGYEYFKKYSLHIEVNIDNKFYQIYFPKLPACCIDFSQIIKKYEEKYDRLSTKTKTKDLLKYSQEIIIKFEHEYKINYTDQEKLADEDDEQVEDDNVLLQAYSKIYLLWQKLKKIISDKIVKQSYTFQTFSFRLAMFQNIIILFSFKSFHQFVTFKWGLAKESTTDDYYDDQNSTPFQDLSFIGINLNPVGFFVNFLVVIQIIQVILNSFVFISLILRDYSFYDNKIDNKYAHQELKIHKYINYLNLILRNKLDKYIKFIQLQVEKLLEFVFEKWVDIGLIACAFLALFNPVVTAILLFDIFRRIPSLKNILQSLIIARYQLFLTFILFLVLTYIFAILVYYFFWDYLSNQCFTLWTCFLFIFDMTFKNNAGYTSSYPPDYTDNWRIGTLSLQQLTYTFIIVIILTEIISGIIIDTLAKLREQDAAKNQDMQTICFICGQKRDYLDRKPGGWDQHVNEDHNRMNYIFFIMYLKFKSKNDLSGFENLIKQQIDRQQINWFPILDFIAEQDGLEEKVQIEKKKQDLRFQEDQIYVDYKEFNEKNIKENVAIQLDSITQKMEVIRKGLDEIVIPNSDSD
ncbi:IP3 receptor calcium ion channel protein (macronuclear) [Tetrahymena thermophila SB210]|uniref:IP3 receptor calcium ion channel protein n=1 Tax=Tetrahymena thermophila (strain SB210) TaxID=312017 RepID=Q22YA6_TETTS|nr:IP3 receptor calcium ion channel protein [Tetrahymena thermophila SB210]EAR90118.2 IP3 receptor calcium ion channel protein [Tetrahymena thermophila SB210]|eukprot:XP_001010363.2 IP3 receptor calcium ion channel protein [Tetrahymena thermophila SB210]